MQKEVSIEIVERNGTSYQQTSLFTFYESQLAASEEVMSFLEISPKKTAEIIKRMELEKREGNGYVQYVSKQRRKSEEYNQSFLKKYGKPVCHEHE